MKKLTVLMLLICLLFSLVPQAHAAGSASVTGPSTVRAGDTITVSFRAGGGILGGEGVLSYDSSLLKLNSCTAAIGGSWAVDFSGNSFVFYDNDMTNPLNSMTTIFTASFTVNANVTPGTPISVTASGVILSDGDQDFGAGSPSWSATIAPPLSGNCDLASLSVSSGISPAFNPSVTNYSASVPFTTASVTVNAKAADSKAKVSVSNPGLTAGGTTEIRVTVTAENGAVKTYTVRISRAQDPNYVPSNNADLESLTVEGQVLSPLFAKDTLSYYIWLPYETETVKLAAKAADSKASVAIGEIPALTAGGVTDVPVTVTAEDKTQQVYTVYVFRAPAQADTQAFFQAIENYLENATTPTDPTEPEATEPEVTEPTQIPEPTTPTETEPKITEPAPQESNDWLAAALLWLGGGLLTGGLIGFTITFFATRPRKK